MRVTNVGPDGADVSTRRKKKSMSRFRTAARALVVEQDTVRRVDAVRLTVIDRDPVRKLLGDGYKPQARAVLGNASGA